MVLLDIELFVEFFLFVSASNGIPMFLASTVSEENSAINHIVFPLYMIFHFSLLFSRFFSLFLTITYLGAVSFVFTQFDVSCISWVNS